MKQKFLIILDGRFGSTFFAEQQEWIDESPRQVFFKVKPQKVCFEILKNTIAVQTVIGGGKTSTRYRADIVNFVK